MFLDFINFLYLPTLTNIGAGAKPKRKLKKKTAFGFMSVQKKC